MRRKLASFSHWIAAKRGENNKTLRLGLAGHDLSLRAVAIMGGGWCPSRTLHPVTWGSILRPSIFFIPDFEEDCNEYFKK